MEQQEVKGDAITPESNPIAYTLSVTTPDEVVAVVNNPEIKPHARPTYELTRNVFFVGFMVAGKTSTSRRLARQCGLATIDLDAYIERRERRAINQIFAEQGEQAFRDMETQVLDEFAHKGPMLVSCGGGIVLREENREILKNNGFVVYLQVTAEQAVERVGDVSNVAFTNGAIVREDGSVYIYYASSDTRLHVASTTIEQLMDYTFNTPSDPLRSADCVKQRCELISKNLSGERKV